MIAIPPNLGGFPIVAENVEPLISPTDFYNELISRSEKARRRIVLTSLYLGNGELEQKLVQSLRDILLIRPEVRTSILLDYLRGTRGLSEGTSSACLLKAISEKAQVYLYHTPHLKGIAKKLLSERNNEIVGLQHMKIYIFDDDVIISGANLSDSYFTNRQDRYILFKNCPQLADYLEKIVTAVGHCSFRLKGNGSIELHPECKIHPFLGSLSDYSKEINQKVMEILNSLQAPEANASDTIVYPLIQMGPFDIFQEHEVLKKLLSSQNEDLSVTMASGYFNCVQEYEDLMLAKSKYPLKIITAAPEANGFFGAQGPSGYIPAMYSWVAETFLEKIGHYQRENVTLYEYLRPGWTFHAKGIWLQTKDQSATIVGSSNYGYRSLHRDLEAQILLVTGNEELRTKLTEERTRLLDCCTVLDSAALKRAEHHVPLIVRIVSRFVRNFF